MAKLSIGIWFLLSSLLATAQDLEQSRLLAANYQSQPLEQALTTLTATNVVGPNTSVEYKAGQSVMLQPGFIAQAGSVFTATVAPVVSSTSAKSEPGFSIRAYPNPFVEQTTVEYTLPLSGRVRHTLLDASGQLVRQSEDATEQSAGRYRTQLEGQDLPVGVYLYQVQMGSQTYTLRLIKN